MDVNIERLKLSVETEREFIKSCAIIDFAETKNILESVNNAILSGVKVNEIIEVLNQMKDINRMKL
jgi:hypothetical protein